MSNKKHIIFLMFCLIGAFLQISVRDINFLRAFIPVNESSFELSKAGFYPMFFGGLIFYKPFKLDKICLKRIFICSILCVVINLLFSLPLYLFNIYDDIVAFFVLYFSVCISNLILYLKSKNSHEDSIIGDMEVVITLFTIVLAFTVLTIYPPDIILFH